MSWKPFSAKDTWVISHLAECPLRVPQFTFESFSSPAFGFPPDFSRKRNGRSVCSTEREKSHTMIMAMRGQKELLPPHTSTSPIAATQRQSLRLSTRKKKHPGIFLRTIRERTLAILAFSSRITACGHTIGRSAHQWMSNSKRAHVASLA